MTIIELTKGRLDRLRQVEVGEITRGGGSDVNSTDFFTRRGHKSAGVRSIWIELTKSGLIRWVRVPGHFAYPRYEAMLTPAGKAMRNGP